MSTKIYNAYKFIGKDNSDLMDLMDVLSKIRIQYYDFVLNTLYEFKDVFLKKSEYNFLDSDIGLGSLKSFSLIKVLEQEMKMGLNSPLNFDASAVIYFYKSDIYVQFFGLKDEFIPKDKFIDFHYQNQVDQSNYDWDKEDWDSMTDERRKELESDWDNRREIWDEIFKNNDVPSEVGLIYTIVPHNQLYNLCMDFESKIEKLEQ